MAKLNKQVQPKQDPNNLNRSDRPKEITQGENNDDAIVVKIEPTITESKENNDHHNTHTNAIISDKTRNKTGKIRCIPRQAHTPYTTAETEEIELTKVKDKSWNIFAKTHTNLKYKYAPRNIQRKNCGNCLRKKFIKIKCTQLLKAITEYESQNFSICHKCIGDLCRRR